MAKTTIRNASGAGPGSPGPAPSIGGRCRGRGSDARGFEELGRLAGVPVAVAVGHVRAHGRLAVLAEVEALDFLIVRHAHRDDQVGDLVEHQRADERVDRDDHQGDQVVDEGLGFAVVEAEVLGEDAGRDHAHHAADAVAGEDVEGVIQARLGFPVDGDVADHAGDQADDHALADPDEARGRGDGDQADHRADAGAEGRRLLAHHPVPEHPAEHGRGRGGVRGGEGHGGRAVGPQGRAGVEAEPPEPEHARAEQHERDVGRGVGVVIDVALAAPEEEGPGEGGEAGRHVDDRAAREVLHAPLVQEALGVPGPVGQRRVDHQAEQDHEQQVGREPHPLRERAGDERGGDDRELELEEREHHQRHGGRELRVRGLGHPVEHEEGPGVADVAAERVAESDAEAADQPDERADAERNDALEHGGDDVLVAHHAAVEERQAGGHQEHQRGGREHPGRVAGVGRVPLGDLAGAELGGEQRREGDDRQDHERDRGGAFHGRGDLDGQGLERCVTGSARGSLRGNGAVDMRSVPHRGGLTPRSWLAATGASRTTLKREAGVLRPDDPPPGGSSERFLFRWGYPGGGRGKVRGQGQSCGVAGPQMASPPRSPVRIRMHSSIGSTMILPSPTAPSGPERQALMIASMVGSTNASLTAIWSSTLRSRFTVNSWPR